VQLSFISYNMLYVKEKLMSFCRSLVICGAKSIIKKAGPDCLLGPAFKFKPRRRQLTCRWSDPIRPESIRVNSTGY
jgi:hypothetical protein